MFDRRRFSEAVDARFSLAVAALGVLGGVVVFVIATSVFPYHSLNHDEGVYLQQAAMLLEGQLFLNPPVEDVFRPWFFVESEAGMYSKYSPVPAAMFAPALALGIPRLGLAAIGGGIVALVALLGAEVFDRPTGLLAGVVVLASPLFLVDASVFLPYAPTTLLNLGFAVAYLQAHRRESQRLAAVAGAAVGLAFFARPYTAVLFAAPFICHALWTMRTRERGVLKRQFTTAALGLAGVALTLGYNAVVTGDPFVFPYLAFAPEDGLGFGHHEILNHERNYTPAVALEANTKVLQAYASDWMTAGVLGTAAAIVGGLYTLARKRTPERLAVLAIAGSVILGELYFWGTLNILGDVSDPTDGLIANLGPYYHFDLLVPSAIFAAVALVAAWRFARSTVAPRLSGLHDRIDGRAVRAVGVAVLAVSALAVAPVALSTANEQIEENREVTRHYEQAYQPFETTDLSNSVVLLADPYGPWLNHPFQALVNDPDYDGETIYALPDRPFEVVDAFPNRTYHRYAYRNAWTPVVGEPVEPTLQRVEHARGESVRLSSTVGVPKSTVLVSIRLRSGEGDVRYTVSDPPSELPLRLTFENGTATLGGPQIDENVTLAYEDADLVSTTLFVDNGAGWGFSYEIDTPVRASNGSVRALTPTLEYCRIPHRCNGRAAYIPSETPQGVFINTTLEARR